MHALASELIGRRVTASDGDVGRIEDLFIDDERWVVRALVVDTGTWLTSRRVLLSQVSAVSDAPAQGPLPVALTREQIERSPDVDTQEPVSRQYEIAHSLRYGYDNYWSGSMLWGATMLPTVRQGMVPVDEPRVTRTPGGVNHGRARRARLAQGRAMYLCHKGIRSHLHECISTCTIGHRKRTHAVMKLLTAISNAIDALNRRVGRCLVWLVLASVLISAGNAISRKAFDLSSNAWLEAQWYLYAAAFLGASGYVLMVDEHVRIDAVAQRFSPRLRAWLDILALLLFVLPLCGLMITLGGALTWRAWEIGEMSYNAGGLVRWPVYACIPVGFGLLALQAVSELIKRSAFLRGERERATTSEADLPPIMSGRAPGAGQQERA